MRIRVSDTLRDEVPEAGVDAIATWVTAQARDNRPHIVVQRPVLAAIIASLNGREDVEFMVRTIGDESEVKFYSLEEAARL